MRKTIPSRTQSWEVRGKEGDNDKEPGAVSTRLMEGVAEEGVVGTFGVAGGS